MTEQEILAFYNGHAYEPRLIIDTQPSGKAIIKGLVLPAPDGYRAFVCLPLRFSPSEQGTAEESVNTFAYDVAQFVSDLIESPPIEIAVIQEGFPVIDITVSNKKHDC